ncbi:hypothetical protein [Streptomyces albogriseolus]|uniref:hypothetical protein n=1 Tax=Streptomyces albogriseolus TaxID=1887 RepID=UPI00382E0558
MTDPQTAAAVARAATQAARLVGASANPYVMVKHGRREDRAAAYDRFIAACAAAYYDGEMDRGSITELLAALQAVQLRAPKHVRYAADDLFDRIAGRLGFTATKLWDSAEEPDLEAQDDGTPRADKEPEGGVGGAAPVARSRRKGAALAVWDGPIRNKDTLLLALGDFTQVARLDVLESWWHRMLLPPPIKRWWLGRR